MIVPIGTILIWRDTIIVICTYSINGDFLAVFRDSKILTTKKHSCVCISKGKI